MCYVFRVCMLRRMEFQLFSLLALCGVFPLLTVFALVDNSEFARCWLFKSGRRPPLGGNVWGFCPNVGQTFFEESRSRQTQQSFFHACSALPRSSYHNWATTTSHNHRKVTMAVFRIIYLLFFKETSLFDWRLVRASVRYFSRTLVAGRKLVGWGGAYLIIVFFLHNCNFTLESA